MNTLKVLIEEYEATLLKKTADRQAAEARARECNEKYKLSKEKLEESVVTGKRVSFYFCTKNILCTDYLFRLY